jgi:hypothetical protein
LFVVSVPSAAERAWSHGETSMSFVLEFWRFLRVRKKYWLLPVLLMMVLFGGLVVLTQGSAVAPFIYTLF